MHPRPGCPASSCSTRGSEGREVASCRLHLMLKRLLGILVVRDIFAEHGVVLLVVRRDDGDQRLRELVLATGIEEVEAKVGPLAVEQAALVRGEDARQLVR